MYDQTINTTSIKTSVMETSIETRILKVGDLIIIKEEQILYKGSRYQHSFIFLTIDLTKTYGQLLGMRFYPNGKHIIDPTSLTYLITNDLVDHEILFLILATAETTLLILIEVAKTYPLRQVLVKER